MAAALAGMLERSSPLSFSLECKHNVPKRICELAIANMGRMEVLYLGRLPNKDTLKRILAQDAPMLRQFSFRPYMQPDMRMSLPARWAAAPGLETLSLACPCVFPPGCTIPALPAFVGYLPVTQGAQVPLSAMFHNVTSLALYRLKHWEQQQVS